MGGCLSFELFEEEANHQQHKIRQEQRKNEINRSLERQYKDSKRKKHNDTDNKEIQQNINNHYYESQNNVKDDKDCVYEKQKQIELKHYHIQQYNLSNSNNNNNNIYKIDTNELKSSKGNILSVLNSNTLSSSTLAPLSPAERKEIASIYRNLRYFNKPEPNVNPISGDMNSNATITNSDSLSPNTIDCKEEFHDKLNDLYLAINHNNAEKIDKNKPHKVVKTEKILRAIQLQYSDISPSPAKINNSNDSSESSLVFNYQKSIEEEKKSKNKLVKEIKFSRLIEAKEKIPEIKFVETINSTDR